MNPPDKVKLIAALDGSRLKSSRSEIITLLDEKYADPRHGHFRDWENTFQSLIPHQASITDFIQDAIVLGVASDITQRHREDLERKLKALSPLRQGPFIVFGITIDAEWRSHMKWSRIAPHVDFKDKLVLDIGCGNGYYAMRMQGLDARLVVGLDPSWHCVFQFHSLQKYSLPSPKAFVLPFTLEEFPLTPEAFDRILSMGVLYHRKDPRPHFEKIYSLLINGGQFILETLIVEDKNTDLLIPDECYANMRNVWMIPGIDLLQRWINDAGFRNIRIVDATMTTTNEQRQTEWMTRYSLQQALAPDDSTKTIEGYQAPLRAVLIAEK